jgi:hypothetical protein
MTFKNLNDKMNYYSEISKKTGENNWNQDVIQNEFIEMISKCNLSNEKLDRLKNAMVKNNASLDMQPSNNKSYEVFNKIVEMKKAEALEEQRRMVA